LPRRHAALDYRGLIEKLDYLSTVSGGGYIGTSITAAMSEGTKGKFPFASELRTCEVPGVQHIRDDSNYLCTITAGELERATTPWWIFSQQRRRRSRSDKIG
jgi:hypothetical protein